MNTAKIITDKIFEAKKKFHKTRAQLPVEEKLKILIELQKIGIEANLKFKNKRVWKI